MKINPFNKVLYWLGGRQSYPVFVIGTGRSGTHWLGYSLSNHPEIRTTIEVQPMFELSTKIALYSQLESKLYRELIKNYNWQILRSLPKRYLDKSHPNIWIADKLKKTYPNALFIGIERSPYATVASMVKHRGVSAWHKNWKKHPVPNRFLGITDELVNIYEDLPLVAQCAYRWLSHKERMQYLYDVLGKSLKIISYEIFANNTEEIVFELQDFLGLKNPIPIPTVRTESLHKWEKQFSTSDVKKIENVVGHSPEYYSI